MNSIACQHKEKERTARSGTGQAPEPHAQQGTPAGAPAGLPLFLRTGGKVQPRLTIGAADDPLEREADVMADRVLRSPASPVSPGRDADRSTGGERASAAFEAGVNGRRGAGSGLPAATRDSMEPRFGNDFSHVRVHHDEHSHVLNRAIAARAFTVGADLFFARGQYRPDTDEGRRLLAHELTHVVQQSGPRPVRSGSRNVTAGTQGESKAVRPQRQITTPAGSLVQRENDPAAAAGQEVVEGGVPVVWGTDTASKLTYASVTSPGHTLAAVAGYLYEREEAAAELRNANGDLPEFLPPGRSLRLTGLPLSSAAQAGMQQAVRSGVMMRTAGMPSGESGEIMLYSFSALGRQYRLTEQQMAGMISGMSRHFHFEADRYKGYSEILRDARNKHKSESNRAIRWISDTIGGVDLPDSDFADNAINTNEQAEQAFDKIDPADVPAALRAFGEAVQLMTRGMERYERANRTWQIYINGTIEGAGGAVTALTYTRNISFGIAAGLAGAVAAPAVFAAASGGLATAGITGTGATVLATGAGIVGAGGAGAVVKGGLEATSATGGELLSMAITPGEQSFDTGYVLGRTWEGVKSGAYEGALGGAGQFLSAGIVARLGARYGLPFVQSLLGRLFVGTATGTTLGFGSSVLDVARGNYEGSALEHMLWSTLLGGGAGGLFSMLPISGLYRTGGTPGNPFSGTPVMPAWMAASPWTRLPSRWSPPANFHTLPEARLPRLPDGYAWARLNNQWIPVRGPTTPEIPMNVRLYGPDAAGRMNYNLVRGNQLIEANAMTRPAANTYPPGNRGDMPMSPDDFELAGGGTRYVRGHNVDYADTLQGPGVTNSNADPLNFTPEEPWWGLRVRNPLVNTRIRPAGGGYRQMNVYDANPPVTRDGTPIPREIFFVETNPAGTPIRAYRIPYGTFNYNAQSLRGLDTLPQFLIPLNQAPPVLLSPAGQTSAAGAFAGSFEIIENPGRKKGASR